MSGAERRAFQAAMTLKYCQGNPRLAERVFGWGRETVQLGLNEHRTGLICWGMQSAYGGDKLWEEKHSEVAQALWTLAELHSQQDRNLPHIAVLHPLDRRGSFEAVACPRFP